MSYNTNFTCPNISEGIWNDPHCCTNINPMNNWRLNFCDIQNYIQQKRHVRKCCIDASIQRYLPLFHKPGNTTWSSTVVTISLKCFELILSNRKYKKITRQLKIILLVRLQIKINTYITRPWTAAREEWEKEKKDVTRDLFYDM